MGIDSTRPISFDLPGLAIASLEDSTRSTGATLFYFANGATAAADIRGGAAATSETSLLEPGSYSNYVDAIVLTGGSTMGLAAGDGVREVLFKERTANKKADFNSIPSVPTAVIYDYGSRLEGQNHTVYPDRELGARLMQSLSTHTFTAGRAGAGLQATANKLSQRIWGGQGLAFLDLGFAKLIAAVVLNPVGDVNISGIAPAKELLPKPAPPGTNTTLSIVVTDVKLTADQLRRLAVIVHSSMARMIFPFHTYYDGDTLFAVSTNRGELVPSEDGKDPFMRLSIQACEAMKQAIEVSALTANSAASTLKS